ncbi:hypothetical protein C9374_001780 [Naegleria lovaniensis]|uniref:Uncharacterized protein n=1 Tax=Naegleria lovaniensis TaxID=51637 RepID=A0AA88GXE4_NAELO|nr:uncharacterized protein C9374_001780 [Naegleria lovaniensis]KAG2387448.1 hypothetical protein C9374_001780 [Naegleria lovaniensis]
MNGTQNTQPHGEEIEHQQSDDEASSHASGKSWTAEDDDLFDQLILDLSNSLQANHDVISEDDSETQHASVKQLREELNQHFLAELKGDGKPSSENNTHDEKSASEPQSSLLENIMTKDQVSPQQEHIEQKSTRGNSETNAPKESFREWLEMNRKVIDLEKECESLEILELFVQHKEQELLKKIISHSNQDTSLVETLFFRDSKRRSTSNDGLNHENSATSFDEDSQIPNKKELSKNHKYRTKAKSERFTKYVLMSAINYLLPSSSIHKHANIKKEMISSLSNESHLTTGDTSSSDEEDNIRISPKHTQNRTIITFNMTSSATSDSTVKHKSNVNVYPTNQFIDKYHEGVDYFDTFKNVIVGGDLEKGGSIKSVALIAEQNLQKRVETLFGIDMSEESWIHFKNYIRKLVLDHNNEDILTTRGENITPLSEKETEYLKAIYPLNNSDPSTQETIKWVGPVEESSNNKNSTNTNNSSRVRSYIANIRALKLLYGISGYGESLLSDSFPPLYSPENFSIIFSTDSTDQEKKTAMENEIRNLEIRQINSANKEEYQYIQGLIENLRENYSNIASTILSKPLKLSEEHWRDLNELVEEMDRKIQVWNTKYEEPSLIEIPSDQFSKPKIDIKEDPTSTFVPLENTYINQVTNPTSWKAPLTASNALEIDNRDLSKGEMEEIRTLIAEKGFSTEPLAQGDSMTFKKIEQLTRKDTEWRDIDEFTVLPFTNEQHVFGSKKDPIKEMTLVLKKFKNGVYNSVKGFKFFGVSPSDSSRKYDWEVGTRLNADEKALVSPYGINLEAFYNFIIQKTHLSTKHALTESKKIASFFFTDLNIDEEKQPLSKLGSKIRNMYHTIMKSDSSIGTMILNALNNSKLRSYYMLDNEKKKWIENSENIQSENEQMNNLVKQGITKESQESYDTGSTYYLQNTFQIDEKIWEPIDLVQFAVGTDVFKIVETLKRDAMQDAFQQLKNSGINIPHSCTVDDFISHDTSNARAIKNKLLLPRVHEIIQERFDKLSLMHLEGSILQMESELASKSISGLEPTDSEKKDLALLKEKLVKERERLKHITEPTFTITPLEQARLEQLGIYQQSLNAITVKSAKEQVDREKELLLEREFRILDQLLDQMNREQRRELLSIRSKDNSAYSLLHQHQEAIKNYARLRSYYNQIARKDSTLREWQSLTLKEKIAFEKEFKKQAKGEYEDIVHSVTRMMQSSQFAETFSFIASGLAKMIADKKKQHTELDKALLASLDNERQTLASFTKEFIIKNGIDQRYRAKQLAKFRKLDPSEKRLREMYNYENYDSSILSQPLSNGPTQSRSKTTSEGDYSKTTHELKLVEELISNEFTQEEIQSLVSHHNEIQHNLKRDRIHLLNKHSSKPTDNLLVIQDTEQDPIFSILNMQPREYLTWAQQELFRKLLNTQFSTLLTQWRSNTEKSVALTVSPHYLKSHDHPLSSSHNSIIYDYDRLVSLNHTIIPTPQNHNKTELRDSSRMDKSTLISTLQEPIFPEIKWKGSYKDLQLVYLKLQLERSHRPHYIRSILEFHNANTPERFLQRSFWKGVWMLPESLSNFIHTSQPPPILKLLPPPPPKKVEKKPPVQIKPTEPPPVITPIIPTLPVPTIQTPPPPVTPTIIPPQMPSIPRMVVPVQRVPPPTPTPPPIQPPSQPSVIPQRQAVTVSQNPIYPRYLLNDLNRRLFQ